MKLQLFILFIALSNILFAQTETEHFIFQPAKGGGTLITPKEKTNEILKKGEATLDWLGYDKEIPWHKDVYVKPFQEMINQHIFSSTRMKELEKNANIRICPYFDESGIIKYVEFWLPTNVTTSLTDKELYAIYQAYMGIKYDISFCKAYNDKGIVTQFYCSDFFEIPFEDLKY